MNRLEIILAGLAAGGENATFAPVQIQKLFFLIDREIPNLVGGPHFHFVAYDYGPFDQSVYRELDALHAQGLVDIDTSGHYRRYSLTAEGFTRGHRILMALPEPTRTFMQQAATWVLRLNFQQLVAAIYKRYDDMRVNSIFRP